MDSGNGHVLIPYDAMAAVMSDSGVMRPVIGIYNADYAPNYEVCSKINLLHEMAHVFQLPEMYATNPSHMPPVSKYNCVMMVYDFDNVETLYNNIWMKNNSPYCDSCLATLWDNVIALSFPAN